MLKTEKDREANLLGWETQVLRSIAQSKPLTVLLHQIVTGVESIIEGSIASILLLDKDLQVLRNGASPNLSKHYSALIENSNIGPKAGSCGTAAYQKKIIIVSDIESDPLWEDYRALAIKENLRSCWSVPILDVSDDVVAIFAVYYRTKRSPSKCDLDVIDRIGQIVGIAIEHDHKNLALKTSQQRIREAFEWSATGIAITNLQGRFLEVNPAYCQMLEYSESELLTLDFPSITHPEDRDKNLQEIKDLIGGKHKSFIIEKRYVSKYGKIVWARISVLVQQDSKGLPDRLIGIAEDISEVHEAEQRHAEVQRSFSTMLSNLPGMIYRCRNDKTWTMLFASQYVEALTGYSPEKIIDNREISYFDLIIPEDRNYVDFEIQQALRDFQPFQLEYRIKRADNNIIWVWEQGRAIYDEVGKVIFLEGYITDITQQKTAELVLGETQRQASAILKSVGEGIYGVNLNGNITFVNQAALKAFGFSEHEMIGKSSHALIHHHYPDGKDYPPEICAVYKTLRDGQSRQVRDEFFFHKDGSSFPVEYMVSPVNTDEGLVSGAVVSFSDISARLTLEEKLRQSQRLESLGQLTGGVAHDFNNLLTVILGNAEFLDERLNADPQLKGLAKMIVSAAQRGSDLTKSLLAFARKQPLEPKQVDISKLLYNMKALLVRSLGDHIEIDIKCNEHLGNALIDPSQLENAIINLSINARDAMPEGGHLKIEASNIKIDDLYAAHHEVMSGDYVMIVVSDTGQGIQNEIITRVFEPFFTTKEKGKGTGLGLSMVYGFIKQSGGYINIYSEPNQGATVRMYLPTLVNHDKVTENLTELPPEPETHIGDKIILLVEDDALVRSYAYNALISLGYHVIQVENGPKALEVIRSNQAIDLLFTDVVMPGGMSGKQLADHAYLIRPALKVLFTSGYTESAIFHHGRLDVGVQLLSKPYRRAELVKKIRLALT